jgi:hypothetical protein
VITAPTHFRAWPWPPVLGGGETNKDESRYDLFVKAISGSIAQAEPHLSQTQRMKRVGQVWKQLAVEERLKIITEHKAKMEAMGIKDKALVDAGPMLQVRGLKRRAKERYTSAPLRPCAL